MKTIKTALSILILAVATIPAGYAVSSIAHSLAAPLSTIAAPPTLPEWAKGDAEFVATRWTNC